jgi:methylthioribulose-1-phosphate dehydratase
MADAATTDDAVRRSADALREVGAVFWREGWSRGTSSNYSVVLKHDPLTLLLTASGMDKGRLGPSDFVVVSGNGRPVPSPPPLSPEGRGEGVKKPSAETALHLVLARRPGVGCVLHTHSVWGTVLSDLYHADGGFWIEGYEMLKGLDGVTTHEHRQFVEIFANTQDIPALAREVGRRLDDAADPLRHGFLIRRHGLYTWGRDVDEARRHVEIFEFLFEVVGRRLSLRGAATLTNRKS